MKLLSILFRKSPPDAISPHTNTLLPAVSTVVVMPNDYFMPFICGDLVTTSAKVGGSSIKRVGRVANPVFSLMTAMVFLIYIADSLLVPL